MKTIPYVTTQSLISDDAKLGVVHLRVANLENQLKFYTLGLKLTVHEQSDTYALLGDTQKPLLALHQHENLKRYHQTTGMYHFALLYPDEKSLAKAIAWLFAIKYENIPTDHGMSKTSYLKDLEGNDIELYIRTIDRADYIEDGGNLSIRYKDGTITDGRDTLDLDELFSNLDESDDIQSPLENMEMGHIHLYGSDLDAMTYFYSKIIGFGRGIIDPKFRMGDVGINPNINHVVAFNSWKQTDLEAPSDAVGLDYYTLVLNSQDYSSLIERLNLNAVAITELEDGIMIKDPSHIKLKIIKSN